MAHLLVRYRAALLSLLGDDAPEVLSGHAIGGRPATSPHIAYVPLANIDHGFADGEIKGIAIVLPRDMRDEDVVSLDRAMSRLRRLHFGRLGDISLRMMGAQSERKSLDFRRYAKASMTWASVTPIALSVHPKPRKGLTEEGAILMDFARLGLPEPTELRLQDVPFVRGAPLARQVPNHEVTSVAGRLLRHVHIRFPRHVEGPLLVGAGRYMGFGLLLPRG
jgi:CRISPR-associated protein Csb2